MSLLSEEQDAKLRTDHRSHTSSLPDPNTNLLHECTLPTLLFMPVITAQANPWGLQPFFYLLWVPAWPDILCHHSNSAAFSWEKSASAHCPLKPLTPYKSDVLRTGSPCSRHYWHGFLSFFWSNIQDANKWLILTKLTTAQGKCWLKGQRYTFPFCHRYPWHFPPRSCQNCSKYQHKAVSWEILNFRQTKTVTPKHRSFCLNTFRCYYELLQSLFHPSIFPTSLRCNWHKHCVSFRCVIKLIYYNVTASRWWLYNVVTTASV